MPQVRLLSSPSLDSAILLSSCLVTSVLLDITQVEHRQMWN